MSKIVKKNVAGSMRLHRQVDAMTPSQRDALVEFVETAIGSRGGDCAEKADEMRQACLVQDGSAV